MTTAWVVGGNGLLGAALKRQIARSNAKLFQPSTRLRWGADEDIEADLSLVMREFASALAPDDGWEIYWAAGRGAFSSTEAELLLETNAFRIFLNLLESVSRLNRTKGALVFASSAGAIYAGVKDTVINENTPSAPTTSYAFEKLRQEGLASEYSFRNDNVTVLLARISTLYGPGQAAGKKQGLISMIARSTLRNQTINIFVPLDTIRDYLTADDAACLMVISLKELSGDAGVFLRIIASGYPTTIAEIISIFKRISRRAPRVVVSATKLSDLYNSKILFSSLHSQNLTRTSISIGIAAVLAAERLANTRAPEKHS